MKKKTLGVIIFLLILNLKVYSENNIFVSYKIDGAIITNADIENESKYLIALNNQLKNLDNKKILEIAEASIVRETIKKNEILKYYELNQNDKNIDSVIKNFYLKLNLNNTNDFEKYLSDYNLTINEIKKKIEIEITWNQLIFEKYQQQVNIDNEELKKKIKKISNKQYKKIYLLSEIFFEKKEKSINDTYKQIEESIKEIGFKNTANIYSISESSKFGGNLGWIEEKNLSEKLTFILKKIALGNYTKPIQVGNKFLILNIDDIKNEKIQIDEEGELIKMIEFETNRQLGQFSKIYYDKVKINTIINEL
jgi:peptidyl-prolyl cis-trans isomerase SurA